MEDEKYRPTKARVEDIKGFYIHVMVFAIINVLLFIINIISTPQSLWFY